MLTVYTADPQSSENLGDASLTAGETETDVLYNPAGPDDQPVNIQGRHVCHYQQKGGQKRDSFLDQANNAQIVKDLPHFYSYFVCLLSGTEIQHLNAILRSQTKMHSR